jgi:hypothetical protein
VESREQFIDNRNGGARALFWEIGLLSWAPPTAHRGWGVRKGFCDASTARMRSSGLAVFAFICLGEAMGSAAMHFSPNPFYPGKVQRAGSSAFRVPISSAQSHAQQTQPLQPQHRSPHELGRGDRASQCPCPGPASKQHSTVSREPDAGLAVVVELLGTRGPRTCTLFPSECQTTERGSSAAVGRRKSKKGEGGAGWMQGEEQVGQVSSANAALS